MKHRILYPLVTIGIAISASLGVSVDAEAQPLVGVNVGDVANGTSVEVCDLNAPVMGLVSSVGSDSPCD